MASIATIREEQWIGLIEGSRHSGFAQFAGTEADMVSSPHDIERISERDVLALLWPQ
jgi:hypothetical protein